MDWRNSEHYPDTTAAEAMSRVMGPDPWEHDELDGNGCHDLIEAVVRKAVEDYAATLRQSGPAALRRRAEAEAFFRSEYFRRLTGMDGLRILRMVRKVVEQE